MSQFERIAYIDRTLRERDSLQSAEAARRFEVSTRQIKRDLEYLRDRLSAPVVDDGTPFTDVDLPAADWRELLGRVLSFGSQAEVLAPPEFRALWKDEIRKMAASAEKKP